MSDSKAAWYAIRSKPRMEEIARLNYERQGLKVYLPMIRKVVRHARSKKEVLRPFFSGYLFLLLAPEEQNWVTIASTRGAIGAVCFGDQYIPMPDWIIDDLRAREDGGAISSATLQKGRLTSGMVVQVRFDEENATQGVVYSMRGEDNVVVLLSLLNRQVKATVPLEKVQIE
ncbi:MAG: transcriptional activator RfaH [Desulfobulbaceae bacterium]|nr:transcriptional activator RfaH [Desulfobulbaceae bacterium]